VKKRVVVNDLMQRRYVYYRTEPPGKNFHSDFKPELTPKQMLRLAGATPLGVRLAKALDLSGKSYDAGTGSNENLTIS
jgi:hypothetical protein